MSARAGGPEHDERWPNEVAAYVLGALDHLEVVNHTRAMDRMKNEPYTDADDEALGSAGI